MTVCVVVTVDVVAVVTCNTNPLRWTRRSRASDIPVLLGVVIADWCFLVAIFIGNTKLFKKMWGHI